MHITSDMGDLETLIEWLFRAKEIELKTKELRNQEAGVNQAQGINLLLFETRKQNLELIKLTVTIKWLTVALVVIGLMQLIKC